MSVAPDLRAPNRRALNSDPHLQAGLLLVSAIVRQLRAAMGPVLSHDELVSLGNEGLVDAMRRFDPERGVEFRVFASQRIRGAIIDGMRREAVMSRRAWEQCSEEYDQGLRAVGERAVSIDDLNDCICDDTAEDLLIRAEQSRAIRDTVDELDPDHAALVRRYYDGGESLSDISEDLGFGPAWGSKAMPEVQRVIRRRLDGYHAKLNPPRRRPATAQPPVAVPRAREHIGLVARGIVAGASRARRLALQAFQYAQQQRTTAMRLPNDFKADVDLVGEVRSALCFENSKEAIMSLPERDMLPVNLDTFAVAATVIGSAPGIRQFRDRAARLDGYDPVCIDQLEERAYAMLYAQRVYLSTVRPDGSLPALIVEAMRTRDKFRLEIRSLCGNGVLDSEIAKDYTGNPGYGRVAADVGLLAGIYRRNWQRLEGRTLRTPDELERAEVLANRITRLLGLRDQPNAEVAEWADLRARAFSLVVRTYDRARRAIVFLRWEEGDAETIAPSLYRGRVKRRHRRESAAEQEPATHAPELASNPASVTPSLQ